jgi:dolichol kinase
MRSVTNPGLNCLPPEWLIEAPKVLSSRQPAVDAAHALLISRRNLVSLSTFCSTILIVHVCASRVTEARHRRKVQVPAGELSHVPRKESRRTYLYVLFTISVTLWILCVKIMLTEFVHLGIWQSEFY